MSFIMTFTCILIGARELKGPISCAFLRVSWLHLPPELVTIATEGCICKVIFHQIFANSLTASDMKSSAESNGERIIKIGQT